VAACRALRAQITRFEDAFIKVHGRPPKSAMDRAPLATTYAQYREWKRAIRADAASRIQAIMRGAHDRMILVHDLKFADIVQRRMGRVEAEVMPPTYLNYPPSRGHGQHGYSGRGLSHGHQNSRTSNLPQMPSGIGTMGKDVQPIPPMPRGGRDDLNGNTYDGVEVVMLNNQPASAWSRGNASPAVDNTDSSSLAYSRASGSTRSTVSYSTRAESVSGSGFPNPNSLNHLSFPELQAKKRELKQLLKKYDMDFFKAQGRMPVKAEKEPIRDLYEQYNDLKSRITAVERNPSLVEPLPLPPVNAQSPRQMWPKQVPSPSSSSTIGSSIHSIQSDYPNSVADSTSVGSALGQGSGSHSLSSSSPSATIPAPRVPNRSRRPSSPSQQGHPSSSMPVGPNTSTSSGSSLGSGSLGRGSSGGSNAPSDLTDLKSEKQQLHQMLRAYEKEFFRDHQRQVSSYADIRPVAAQYRRYKEIKKSIMALQQQQAGAAGSIGSGSGSGSGGGRDRERSRDRGRDRDYVGSSGGLGRI